MNNVTKKREGILRKSAVQTIIASLLCIVIGIIIGYIVLLNKSKWGSRCDSSNT